MLYSIFSLTHRAASMVQKTDRETELGMTFKRDLYEIREIYNYSTVCSLLNAFFNLLIKITETIWGS